MAMKRKYGSLTNNQQFINIRCSVEEKKKIQELAVKAFKAIDGKGLARIDFFIESQTGKIYLNEINTMPGFTTISMYGAEFHANEVCQQYDNLNIFKQKKDECTNLLLLRSLQLLGPSFF